MALRRQSPHELEGSQAIMRRSPIAIPAGVIGQVRRDGRRQARLARLLAADEVEIEVPDRHVGCR
jgi:hypothetical protein